MNAPSAVPMVELPPIMVPVIVPATSRAPALLPPVLKSAAFFTRRPESTPSAIITASVATILTICQKPSCIPYPPLTVMLYCNTPNVPPKQAYQNPADRTDQRG